MSSSAPTPSLAPKTLRFADADQFRSAVRHLSIEFTPLVRDICAEPTILKLVPPTMCASPAVSAIGMQHGSFSKAQLASSSLSCLFPRCRQSRRATIGDRKLRLRRRRIHPRYQYPRRALRSRRPGSIVRHRRADIACPHARCGRRLRGEDFHLPGADACSAGRACDRPSRALDLGPPRSLLGSSARWRLSTGSS